MKQTYKKKPEFLDVVFVADDTQSIKDVYEVAGVSGASISFDSTGERVITLEDGTKIGINDIVFKEKKSGKLVVMPQEKLLQFYDLWTPEEQNSNEPRKIYREEEE